MNLSNVRVAPKLWVTILGLLVVMTLCNIWVQQSTMNTMEQSRQDVQQIEGKIALAESMRGKILRSIESGIAMQATNEARLQDAFTLRFKNLYTIAFAALEEMKAALVSERDHQSFDVVLAAFDDLKSSRERAVQTIDLDDYNARADYALGEYVRYAEIYGEKIGDFIELQRLQLKEKTAAADAARERASIMGWISTVVLLLLGVVLARWLVLTVTRPLHIAVEAAENIGEGRLDVRFDVNRKDEFGQLLQALNAMAGKLRMVVGDVRTGVDAVSSAASQIASGNQDLSSRTEQSAASLQQTAASIEQMTANVSQSADTSRQANQLAVTAVQAAERGGQVVEQVVQSMAQINASSRKINDIIGVIDGIAFQTNILALNAAVEAARAGEQGRGFAVVAGEVRSLAQRSAEAAKEIKGLISTSVGNVEAGSLQVEQAGANMQEIVSSVRRVTDLIGEITAAASEQANAFQDVNRAVNGLDQMTQQNAALVEESSAAAGAMSEQAQRLLQVVSVFQLGHAATRAVEPAMVSAAAQPSAAAPAVPRTAKPAVKPSHTPSPVAKKATASAARSSAAPAALNAAPSVPAKSASDDEWETF